MGKLRKRIGKNETKWKKNYRLICDVLTCLDHMRSLPCHPTACSTFTKNYPFQQLKKRMHVGMADSRSRGRGSNAQIMYPLAGHWNTRHPGKTLFLNPRNQKFGETTRKLGTRHAMFENRRKLPQNWPTILLSPMLPPVRTPPPDTHAELPPPGTVQVTK